MQQLEDNIHIDYVNTFISYRRSETKTLASWLRRHLEAFRFPQSLQNLEKNINAYLDTSFEKPRHDFWKETILPELQKADYLIVILSPSLEGKKEGKGDWVIDEINAFIFYKNQQGIFSPNQILLVGALGADERCIPEILQEYSSTWSWINFEKFSWKRCLPFETKSELDNSLSKVVASICDVPSASLPLLYREKEKHRSLILQRVVSGISLIALLMIALAGWAMFEKQRADEEANIAIAKGQASRALLLKTHEGKRLPQALALAENSLDRHWSLETSSALQSILNIFPQEKIGASLDRDVSKLISSEKGDYFVILDQPRIQNSVTSSQNIGNPFSFSANIWSTQIGLMQFQLTHSSRIVSAAIHSNKNLIVTAGENDGVKFWSLNSGSQIKEIPIMGKVWGLAISPNGNYLATSSTLSTTVGPQTKLSLWDLSQITTPSLIGHQLSFEVKSIIRFDPTGKFLVAAGGAVYSAAEYAEIWQVDNFTNQGQFDHSSLARSPSSDYLPRTINDAQTNAIYDAQLCSTTANQEQKSFLATAGQDGSARMWDLSEGKTSITLLHQDIVSTIAFNQDCSLIATASYDNTVRLWDTLTGREIQRRAHDDIVGSVSFSPLGNYLISSSYDSTSRVWSVPTLDELARVITPGRNKESYFSSDDKLITTIDHSGNIATWDFHGLNKIGLNFANANKFAFNGSKDSLIVGTNGAYHFYDLTKNTLQNIEAKTTGLQKIFLSKNNDFFLALNDNDDQVTKTNLNAIESVQDFPIIAPLYRAFSVSRDEQYMITESENYKLTLWDIESQTELNSLKHPIRAIKVDFSEGGNQLYSAEGPSLTIRDLPSFVDRKQLLHPESVLKFKIYNGEKRAITLALDGKVRIWDLENKTIFSTIDADITSRIEVSHNENYLAVTGFNNKVEIYDLNRSPVLAYKAFDVDGQSISVAFSSDDKYLAIGSSDSTARVFEFDSKEELIRVDHLGLVVDVDFSKDDKFFVSDSEFSDIKIVLWQKADLLEEANKRIRVRN